jgi:hypothetical protein
LSGNRTYGRGIAYYTDDKTFISTEVLSGFTGVLTPPSNASYLRINGNLTDTNVQIEVGTEATEYEPYRSKLVYADDIADVEHFETIYDYSDTTKQTINGVAYSSGILFNSSATYTFDGLRDKYKGVYVTIKIYAVSNTCSIYIPLVTNVARSSFLGVDALVTNNDIAYGTLYFENNILHPLNCARHSFTNTGGTITSLNDNSGYAILNITGVLK